MVRVLKYIEMKSGHSDNGPAWIGYVEYSKSGKSIYFNDKVFGGNGHGGCTDLETGEVYWISGIKKDGNHRHRYGGGVIQIDENAIEEYELLTGINVRANKKYQIVTVEATDKNRLHSFQNEKLS